MLKFKLILSGILLWSNIAAAVGKLTYVDLIERLTDLEQLAVLPEPGEKCQQWSSYDRTSQYNETTGTYVNWAANRDNNGMIREENGKWIMAEMSGPGVIWRIWSALAIDGHVRIYLDGAEEPAVDLPFNGYFNRANEPFTPSALVHWTSGGSNNYVPIPYQKSCKIVADDGWGEYFHFTYTNYPKGMKLPTFSRQLSPEERVALDRANTVLASCGVDPVGKRYGEVTIHKTVRVKPGKTATITALKGKRAITAIKVKVKVASMSESYGLLRELALKISWDNEKQPSVWVPLGDFFGSAPGVNYYKSLPLGMTEDGFYSYWYMPFEKSAIIELINDGKQMHKVTFTITHSPVTSPIKKLGRFHAKWHRDMFLPQDKARRAIDWTMLKTKGRGRFCGAMLHVWNPKRGWWGEGDEKFFVDGEKFPSTFGTGSEDYFGYAWSNPGLFNHCYHNQTISMNNRGHISVNRWHITDNVPFQNSFEATIEKYFPNSKPTLYACVAYWYQEAGQSDPYEKVSVKERKGYWVKPDIFKVEGALEGEDLKIIDRSGGGTRWQHLGAQWSDESQLWWIDGQCKDTLDLALPVEKASRYRLLVQLTKAVDYGIVQLYLDGNKLGKPIDLFNKGVVPTGELELGVHNLDAGEHVFRVEIVDANEQAVKAYMFGLDYLLLEETK